MNKDDLEFINDCLLFKGNFLEIFVGVLLYAITSFGFYAIITLIIREGL